MAGGGWRGALSRARAHLPDGATLRLARVCVIPGRPRDRRGLRCDAEAGEAEAGPGACGVHGEEGVRGPDGQVCEHLVSPHCGWVLWGLGVQERGRQQVQIHLPRWLGKAFLFIVPRGTPLALRNPYKAPCLLSSDLNCAEHTRLLSRFATLGFKIKDPGGADTFHAPGLGQALRPPVVINTLLLCHPWFQPSSNLSSETWLDPDTEGLHRVLLLCPAAVGTLDVTPVLLARPWPVS